MACSHCCGTVEVTMERLNRGNRTPEDWSSKPEEPGAKAIKSGGSRAQMVENCKHMSKLAMHSGSTELAMGLKEGVG